MRFLRFSALVLTLPLGAAEPPWLPLFDGKTLKGWEQRGGKARYEVRDGAIVGASVPDTPNSFLCTERRFGDFVLELEFRVDEAMNSGIQVRGQSRPDYQNGRVHGYQVEIDPDVKRNRMWTGGLYDEGRRGWLVDLTKNEPARRAFRPGEWNRFRIEAKGDSIRTWLNGVAAADLVDSMDVEGFIGLQVHSVGKRTEPLQVAWRNLRIQDHGRRAWLPLHDEKDLRGFDASGGVWSVAGGVLTGIGKGVLSTKQAYTDFTMRMEYRATGEPGALRVRGKRIELAPGDWASLAVSARGGRVVVHRNGILSEALDAEPRAGPIVLEASSRLEARGLAVMSDPIPPPVAGFPVGRCVRVLGVTAPEDAKTVGYEYLELALQDLLPLSDAEFERVVQRLRAVGLPLVSGYGFMPADVRIVGPSVNREEVDEHLRRGLARAAKLRLEMVVYGNLNTASRRAPDGFPREEAWKQLVEFGRSAAREGARHGITVLIEPMPARSTNMVNTVAEGVQLVEAVGDRHFRLLVDFAFMTQGGEDMAILRTAARYIRQVEISNPNGRVYPRDESEADYATFFRALVDGGYQGGFSVHGQPDIFFADAPRAIAVLRRLVGRAAGL